MKIFFNDLETTGLKADQHGVGQIAGFFTTLDRKEITIHKSINYMVRPFKGDLISQGALTATHVTVEELRSRRAPEEVFPLLFEQIDKFRGGDKLIFAGYNSGFDFDFLREWYKKNGSVQFLNQFYGPPFCIMQAAMNYLLKERKSMPRFRLQDVVKKLKIHTTGTFHNALVDIRATIKIYAQIQNYTINDLEEENKIKMDLFEPMTEGVLNATNRYMVAK